MTPSIVCGIDASPQAGAALRVASALAQRMGLTLVVVHAVPTPTPDLLLTAPAHVPVHVEQIDFLGHDTGERLLTQAVEAVDVPLAEQRLERGRAAERLCAVAREEQARLVVVGSRGDGAIRTALLGSVSAAVVRDAPCPVVVVPPGMAGGPLDGQRIVCGVNADEDQAAVSTAARLSRVLGAPLTLSHVLPAGAETESLVSAGALSPTVDPRLDAGPRHALDTVHRLMANAGDLVDDELHDVQLRRGEPAAQILELAASTHAILLVVGNRGFGSLRAGLLGSVSRDLVRRGSRPIVICREEPT